MDTYGYTLHLLSPNKHTKKKWLKALLKNLTVAAQWYWGFKS